MAKALKCLHNDNIVHLDVKPENILLGRSGKFKLADFGLARLCSLKADLNELQEGDFRFCPSELLNFSSKTAELDHFVNLTKADIFSLGVSLFSIMSNFDN